MTRSYHFAKPIGKVRVELAGGGSVELPVIPGILKHPRPQELFELLTQEAVARKYTRLALEKAAWQVLRKFPRAWLIEALSQTKMRDGRLLALRFLLKLDPHPFKQDGL